MKYKVEYNPEFYHDMVEAVDWYNQIQTGLGNRFYTSIKQQTQKLSSSALHFAVKYDDVRCLCVERFPYLVHFRVNEQTQIVKVEALFHTSRDPKIWNERID